ncbi:MAG TPA: hypothetical protein VFW33_07365, partial [Gemmataceae bacterium]|nr:hypothetical protein [Gemmataceae bacterium]
LTATGVLGTPQYMAPEQWAREDGTARLDVRTDVYGLGVTLYELLTLRRAFDGGTHEEIGTKVLSAEAVPPQALVGNVPADLVAVCRKAMRKDREARYPTARECADDLRRWLRHEPTKAHGAWVGRRMRLWTRRNPGWAAACVLALLVPLLAISAVAGTYRARSQAAERQALIQQAQGIRLLRHSVGWRDDAWGVLRDAARLGRDDNLKHQAAATLQGLDALTEKTHRLDASSLAFDPRGRRFLMGGFPAVEGRPAEAARLCDTATGDVITPSKTVGGGPVAFSRDGAALQLVAEDRSSLLLWDVTKQQPVRRFRVVDQDAPVGLDLLKEPALALAPDGRAVAVSAPLPGEGGVLRVWDTTSGKELLRDARRFASLAISPDGNLLAAGDAAGKIVLWSLRDRKELAVLAGERWQVHALAFRRDSRRSAGAKEQPGWLLAAGGEGGNLVLWDLKTGLPRTFYRGSHYDVFNLAFSPDGTLLASGGRFDARVWDAATGLLLLTLPDMNWTTGLAFSPDGKQLAAARKTVYADTGKVDVWKLEDGRGARTLRGLAGAAQCVYLSRSGKLAAALTHDWRLGIWDLPGGRLRCVLEPPPGFYVDNVGVGFAPDDARVALASGKWATLWALDGDGARPVDSWELPPGLQDTLAFDPTGKHLLLARVETKDMVPVDSDFPSEKHPRVCRLRELLGSRENKLLATIQDYGARIYGVAGTADGARFAVEGIDGKKLRTVKVIEGTTGKEVWTAPSPSKYDGKAIGFDALGELLLIQAGAEERVDVLDVKSGRSAGAVPLSGSIGPGLLYLVGPPGITLYRTQGTRPLVRFDINGESSSQNICFSADSHFMAWGQADGTMILCDLEAVQQELAKFGLGW